MPGKRVSMRKTREVLRLRFDLKLGQRQIARSANISQSTVHDYLERFTAAGMSWPLPAEMSEAQVEAALFPAALGKGHDPDFFGPMTTPPRTFTGASSRQEISCWAGGHKFLNPAGSWSPCCRKLHLEMSRRSPRATKGRVQSREKAGCETRFERGRAFARTGKTRIRPSRSSQRSFVAKRTMRRNHVAEVREVMR